METTVTVSEKKEFIRWFLKNYKMKRRETVWILNYLISHEDLLMNVEFTDEAHYCKRSMVMSTTEHDGIPFRYYHGNLMTADADRAFHELREKNEEKLYMQLNFPNKYLCENYAVVHIENPSLPEEVKRNKQDAHFAELVTQEITEKYSKNALLQMIDKALDNKDEELFLKLTNKLLKMN